MLARRSVLAATALLPLGGLLHTARAAAPDDRPMPAPGRRAWADKVPVIRIGILGGENDADRLGRYGAYQKLLEDTFKVPVKLLLAADYAGVIQGFAAGQLEASYMSPAAYAAAWMESNGNVIPILTTEEADGAKSYVAAMYVRADSNIHSIADMKGRSLAWSDPNSASGYLIPRAELRAKGIDPDKYFGRTGFAGGHEQAVIAVLHHQYDAGVTWTSGVGDRAKGYTRGTLRLMADHKLLDMKDIRIIWESRPIMNGPFVLRADTPAAFRADMLTFHRGLPVHYPAIYHQVDMGQGKDWVPVTHADYQVFIDIRKAEAAARRQR